MEGRPRTVEEVDERQRTLREEFRRLQHALDTAVGEGVTKEQLQAASRAYKALWWLARGLNLVTDYSDPMPSPEAWQKALEGLVRRYARDRVADLQDKEVSELQSELQALRDDELAALNAAQDRLNTRVEEAQEEARASLGRLREAEGRLKDLSERVGRLEEIARELDACEANGASARAKPAGGLMEGRGKPRRRGRAVCHPGTRGERRRARR
jgi:hypothetical protein